MSNIKTKMTVEIEIDAAHQNVVGNADVRQILRDALGEFLSTRMSVASAERGMGAGEGAFLPADAHVYVQSRYAHMDEVFRSRKCVEVSKRANAALGLLRGSVTLTTEATPAFMSLEDFRKGT